jgi:hypothetical protein
MAVLHLIEPGCGGVAASPVKGWPPRLRVIPQDSPAPMVLAEGYSQRD